MVLNQAWTARLHFAIDERGPEGPPDPLPNMAYDFIVDGFDDLRRRVLARLSGRHGR